MSIFICLWDSRARDDHWVKKEWPLRDFMIASEIKVVNEPLIVRKKNHHSTTAHQTWFDETVFENLAYN